VINIANNDTLWVQAQMYDTELPLLHQNTRVWVQIDGFGEQKLAGNIVFDNLVNEKDSRVHLLNIAIANPQGQLQPGMAAYVYLQTSKGSPLVVIPKSSVIYGQDADYVWVKQPDSVFERRKVQLGKDNTLLVAVLQGLKRGSRWCLQAPTS
jgi:Cu(I)/Ag(I) efflux system membrane fusion protein